MQHQRRRYRIQQLRIINANNHHPPVRAPSKRLRAPPHQLKRLVRAHLVRDQAGKRPERNRCRTGRRLRPMNHRPLALRRRERLARQPRLTDTGHGADHHTRAPTVRPRLSDALQLPLAPDQRPRIHNR